MRIASLTPALTEIICCIGGREDLVALSAACDHPVDLAALPRVADLETVDGATLRKARPDLVLVGDRLQARLVREVVEAGLPVLVVAFTDLASVLEGIRLVGRTVDRDVEAAVVADGMANTFRILKARGERFTSHPRVFVEANGDPLLVGEGWVPEVVETAGGCDVFTDIRASRIEDRVVSDAVARERDPEIHVLAWWGRRGRMDAGAIAGRPGWDGTSASRNERVYVVDDATLLRPGPRLVEGMRRLQAMVEAYCEVEGRPRRLGLQ